MKVLSIDVDYVTSEYQKFINKVCSSRYSDFPNYYWKDIDLNFGNFHKDFRVNFDNLFYIFSVFNKSFLCSKKVIFSYYHDCILNHIIDADSLEITNIDMHHDLYYREHQLYTIDSLDTCDECNWVMFLDKHKKLEHYIWIRDKGSHLPENAFFERNVDFYYKFTTKEEYTIPSHVFDLVFVCLSPQYIAPSHWHYFELLKNNYQNITGKEPIMDNKRFQSDFDITENKFGLIL